MFSSGTIQQEVGAFRALLQILADPAKVKEQLEELQEAAEKAADAETKLVEERLAFQQERQRAEEVLEDAIAAVGEANRATRRAGQIVGEAVSLKSSIEALVSVTLNEARKVLASIQTSADDIQRDFNEVVATGEARLVALDAEIAAKQAKLSEITRQLSELRERL